MAQGTRPGGGDSFMAYMVGQRAKQGHGLQAIDKAAGLDKMQPVPASNTGTPQQSTQAAPPPVAPPQQAPVEPGIYANRSNLVRTQPALFQPTEVDRFYQLTGKMPTAAELSAHKFSERFRQEQGRSPTRNEIMAQLFRMPELLQDPPQEYEVER